MHTIESKEKIKSIIEAKFNIKFTTETEGFIFKTPTGIDKYEDDEISIGIFYKYLWHRIRVKFLIKNIESKGILQIDSKDLNEFYTLFIVLLSTENEVSKWFEKKIE